MTVLWAAALIISLPICWTLTLFGLPGNWLIVVATATYCCVVPVESRLSIGWPIVVVLLVLAAAAELFELLAGALGVAKAGGSRGSAALALIGSIIGSLIGAVVGLPVPVIGSVVAIVLFAGLGAFVGAIVGEDMRGRPSQEAVRVGVAAFWGRLLGTLSKAVVATVMAVVTVVALVHP